MCDDNIITKIFNAHMYPDPSPKLHVPDSP